MQLTDELAECVGLWLAEGDNKTKTEVTFTNNCFDLIMFFHSTIKSIYSGTNKPRIYVYSPSPRKLYGHIGDIRVNYYQDRRANRSYYIYRLSDVKFIKQWRSMVNIAKETEQFYPEILRGFFAGEGNVKHDLKNHNSRQIRISQSSRDEFTEKLLDFFNIEYNFKLEHRDYWISASQLEKADALNIASLHPEKEAKFRKMINCIKEKHYPVGVFKQKVASMLTEFHRSQEIADTLNKSDMYVLQILRELKGAGVANYVRDGINTYWERTEQIEQFVLKKKLTLLRQLDNPKSATLIAKEINKGRKGISRQLKNMEKDGLITRDSIKSEWQRTRKGTMLVAGVDEAGNE